MGIGSLNGIALRPRGDHLPYFVPQSNAIIDLAWNGEVLVPTARRTHARP
jgi:hypothetical protein